MALSARQHVLRVSTIQAAAREFARGSTPRLSETMPYIDENPDSRTYVAGQPGNKREGAGKENAFIAWFGAYSPFIDECWELTSSIIRFGVRGNAWEERLEGNAMAREAGLFDAVNGSPTEGFFILRESGGNIPPNWIQRATESRKNRQTALAAALKAKKLDAVSLLRDWELAYRKECFYYGLRALLEMERNGKTKY